MRSEGKGRGQKTKHRTTGPARPHPGWDSLSSEEERGLHQLDRLRWIPFFSTFPWPATGWFGTLLVPSSLPFSALLVREAKTSLVPGPSELRRFAAPHALQRRANAVHVPFSRPVFVSFLVSRFALPLQRKASVLEGLGCIFSLMRGMRGSEGLGSGPVAWLSVFEIEPVVVSVLVIVVFVFRP